MRKQLFMFALAAVLLSGCGMSGYGPPRDYSSFVSAKASPGHRYGVFTHHLFRYSPAAGWRAFPDGGIPRYDEDANVLGILDLATGEVRVVCREKNRYFQPGQGSFFVSHVSDAKAVISQYGQKRSGYEHEGWWFMLDLDTGKLTRMDLITELAEQGRGMGYFYLLDDRGTLAFVTPPLGAGSDYVHKESNIKEVWLRHPGGQYEKAGEAIHYYPSTDGLVHYYSPDGRYLVYDPAAGTSRRPAGRYPPPIPDVTFDLTVSSQDKNRLFTTEKADGKWVYKDAGVEAADLY